MLVKIYHNPRCSKSRQTLALLEEKGLELEVIEYLKTGLSPEEVKELWQALGEESKNLVRTKEDEYKADKFATDELEVVAKKLSAQPKLLERPIVVVNKKARLGRPPENVLSLL